MGRTAIRGLSVPIWAALGSKDFFCSSGDRKWILGVSDAMGSLLSRILLILPVGGDSSYRQELQPR